MSQSEETDGADSELITEARSETGRPGGLAGPVGESTDDDGIGVASSGGSEASARPRSLWHDRNFLTMWSGQAFSQFGSQIQELAIPVMAVLLLNATEFQVGVLTAAGVAAFLVVGLPAGAWIDRMRKRHVMIWADGVRALALGMLPLLWWLGALQMWHLYAVALIVGVATVFFDVSYQSIIPSLVKPSQIAEANGKLQSTYEIANIAGPGIGGWLVGALTAPIAILATVGTYLISFVALLFTRDNEPARAPEDRAPILHEIWEGLRFVFTEKLLRRIVGTTGIVQLLQHGLDHHAAGLHPARARSEPRLDGSHLLARRRRRTRRRDRHPAHRAVDRRSACDPRSARSDSASSASSSRSPRWSPRSHSRCWWRRGSSSSFTVLLYNITQVTFRQRITPPRLLGRMNASVRFVVWGVMPIAALLSGILGTWLGVVPTMWIGAIGQLFSALFVIIGPFWSMRDLPDVESAESR